MNLLLTIKKEKCGRVWGHLFFMDNLLIENASTVEDLIEKFETTLYQFYELEKNSFCFNVIAVHTAKARQMVARLIGIKKFPPIEVSFNSNYFT